MIERGREGERERGGERWEGESDRKRKRGRERGREEEGLTESEEESLREHASSCLPHERRVIDSKHRLMTHCVCVCVCVCVCLIRGWQCIQGQRLTNNFPAGLIPDSH